MAGVGGGRVSDKSSHIHLGLWGLVGLKDVKAASNTHLTVGTHTTRGAGEEGGLPSEW